MTNGSLKFDDRYVADVVDGSKTATVRFADDSGLDVGDLASLRTDDGAEFATARIQRSAWLPIVEVPGFLDLVGAEYEYRDVDGDRVDALIEGLARHYDEGFKPSTIVRAIVFEVVE